jgi:hypothetical protein
LLDPDSERSRSTPYGRNRDDLAGQIVMHAEPTGQTDVARK